MDDHREMKEIRISTVNRWLKGNREMNIKETRTQGIVEQCEGFLCMCLNLKVSKLQTFA